MSRSDYLTIEEIAALGFGSFGSNVLIHRSCNVVTPHAIHIGSNVRIDGYSVISNSSSLRIGDYVHIGSFTYIAGRGKVILDDFCGLSQGVKLYASTDDYSGEFLTNPTVPQEFTNVNSSGVYLGRHVIVGSGSVILPGVDIGEGSSVGALSLVNRSLAPWGVYAGVPARRLKDRSRGLLKHEERLRCR